MAQKLKNLKVTKVDFVDAGANPRADIKLFKRKAPEETEVVHKAAEEDKLADSVAKKIADALAGIFKRTKIEKEGAETFKETMNTVNTEKIREEIWSVCCALQRSLCSIVSDEELDSLEMLNMMKESIDDFRNQAKGYASIWAAGETAEIQKNFDALDKGELPMLITAHDSLGELIEKARIEKGEPEEMVKIDKSKMTPEERAAYEEIIKKYAVDDTETVEKKDPVKPGENEEEIEEETEKACGTKKTTKKSVSTDEIESQEDIYKGLHPAVKAEIESLRKFREDAEDKELHEVAKRYAIIGKKEEELFPVLKSLKAAGGTAYSDMIVTMDAMAETMKNSGVFSEIGKSGGYGNPAPVAKSASETKVDVIAKGYIEKDPSMSYVEAVAKAWENHPELMATYDEEAGF